MILSGSGGAVIKAVQRGTATMASSVSTLDIPITAVDLSKAYVQFTFTVGTGTPGESTSALLGELTSTMNLRFRRWNPGSVAITINWEVIEFSSGVNVQQVGASFTGATNGLTITAVNTAKTFLVGSWLVNSGGSTFAGYLSHTPRFMLTSATSIQVDRPDTGTTISTEVKVFAIEFK